MTRDDRGMSTVVSHVLSVGITLLLIVGLVGAATGFLEDRQQTTARDELETIGNRLANEVTAADHLGRGSEGATVRSSLPGRVAGSTYTAQLQTSGCSGAPACLTLVAAGSDHSTVVPIRNETELSLRSGSDGEFTIVSEGSPGTADPDRRRVELSPRIGIGHDVDAPGVAVGGSFSQRPVAAFDFDPDPPDTSDVVDFDASASYDPDGTIAEYRWDWNGNGTFETVTSDPVTQHSYSSPGEYNVTLEVVDGSGTTGNTTMDVDVSGLEYNDDMDWLSPGNEESFDLTVTNQYGSSITVERVLIDPEDSSFDDLAGSDEIEIDVGPDGSVEGFANWSSGVSIPEDGLIVTLDPPSGASYTGSEATLPSGATAAVTIQSFQSSITGENVTVGLRYRIGGSGDLGANLVTDTVSGP